jgi:KRAB domain-containing zinc finger protein
MKVLDILCNFQSTTFSSLKVHNQMKHEEVKYPCYHCDYKATHKSSLKRHNQSMHEGVKYVCNQCDYQVTYPEYMRRHIDSKHDDVEKFNKSDFYSICRIDFVQNQNISESNIECPECRMSFSIESQMEAHFLKVHDHVCK